MRKPALSVEDSLSNNNIGNITTPPKSVFMALLWSSGNDLSYEVVKRLEGGTINQSLLQHTF